MRIPKHGHDPAEAALKALNLPPAGKAALDDARARSVALKTNEDETCHKVIAEALPEAGMSLT